MVLSASLHATSSVAQGLAPATDPPDCISQGLSGGNSILFQFNEVKLNTVISGTIHPQSSPSLVPVTTPAAASEMIKAWGSPLPLIFSCPAKM